MDNSEALIIHLRVKLFGHLRQISLTPLLEIEAASGCSVLEVIQEMTANLGEEFRQAVFDSSGSLQGGIEVVLDEEHLPARKIASIKITKDGNLFILPMIEGG